MSWDEIDRERGTWTIPGSRTKNGRAHTVPLTGSMLALLADVPHRVSRAQLFGVRGNGYTAWGDGKAALDAKLTSSTSGWFTISAGPCDPDGRYRRAAAHHRSGAE